MLRFAARFLLLPLAMAGVGSWLGLGKPDLGALRHAEMSFTALPPLPWLTRDEAPSGPTAPVAEDAQTPPVDPSLLPDPNPWPSLNPAESVTRAWLLSEGPRTEGQGGRRFVTLTFDDGPFPETTPVVLKVLDKHHVRATFFWIGRYLDGSSDRAVRTRETALAVRDAGHLIGTHTHDHERLIGISHAEVLGQIDRGMASIQRAIGVRPSVFRPPFGQLDAYGETLARERGLTLVLWNIETQDLRHTDVDLMAKNLEDQIDFAGGGIVLLHDIRFSTAAALDKLLTWLDHHKYDPQHPEVVGYDVVDFAEFTRATAASPQPYANRAALEEARAATWRSKHGQERFPVAACDEDVLSM